MVFPFVWQILTAFKTFNDAVQRSAAAHSRALGVRRTSPTVFDSMPFGQMFVNSVVLMTAGRTVGQVVLCTLAGYAFARLPFRGRNVLRRCSCRC